MFVSVLRIRAFYSTLQVTPATVARRVAHRRFFRAVMMLRCMSQIHSLAPASSVVFVRFVRVSFGTTIAELRRAHYDSLSMQIHLLLCCKIKKPPLHSEFI